MYDNTVSARTYLSYIAEQAGGIAVIGRDGKLYIKTIGENSVTLPLKLFKTFKWGEKFKITRVRYDDGIQLFEKGDTTGNTVYISQDNMYIVDQDQINNIYNTLKGLEFYSFEGECIIDPALDTGDIVVIDGKNVIYQGSMQFSGRWIANIESKIQCKAKEETTTRTPSQRTINRRVESNINQIDGKITQLTEETTENTQKITKVEQDVNGITSKVSSVEQSVENITKIEGTAEGKNIYIDDASAEPLIDIMLEGESQQATRSGKNLAILGVTSGTIGEVPFIVDKGTININGTTISKDSNYFFNSFRVSNSGVATFWIEITGYTDKLSNQAGILLQESSDNSTWSTTKEISCKSTATKQYQVTLDNSKYYRIRFYTKENTFTNATIKIQLEYGTNKTEFEEAGVSPSPDYLSEIENLEGKNKFNYLWFDTTKEVDWTYYQNMNISGAKAIPIFIGKGNVATFSSDVPLLSGNNLLYAINDLAKFSNLSFAASKTQTIKANNEGYVYVGYIKSRTNYDKVKDGTYYVQVEEGMTATPYVPYNSLGFLDIEDNLIKAREYSATVNNVERSITNGLVKLNGTMGEAAAGSNAFSIIGNWTANYSAYDTSIEYIKLKAGTYTLSIHNVKGSCTEGSLALVAGNTNPKKTKAKIQLKNETSKTFTLEEESICRISVEYNVGCTFNNFEFNVMLNKGSQAPYIPYQEQAEYFPLSEGQKLMEGSYLADDGIHHVRKQVVLTGTENWNLYLNKTKTFKLSISPWSYSGVCTHYQGIISSFFDVKAGIYLSGSAMVIISDPRFSTVEEFKTYLAEQYSAGTPVTFEYIMMTNNSKIVEKIVPYTDDQKEAWEKLRHFTLFKGINNITSTANAKITYVRDNGLSDTYETKRNIRENYYTKSETDSQISQTADSIKESVKEINEQTQEKLATLELANQSLEFATKRTGGNNLVRNSAMINDNNFWLAHAKYPYQESDTPPDNPTEGSYWYCTANSGSYIENQMYVYNSGWQVSELSRKSLLSAQNYFAYTTSNEYWANGKNANENTLSGRVIKLDGRQDYTVSHIFNITEPITLNQNENKMAISHFIKNSIVQGNVCVGLMFLNEADFTEVEKPYSLYEPGIILTPDDLKDLTKIEQIIEIPKKSDFIPVVVSNTAPTDTTKNWLDTTIYLPKKYNSQTSQWEILDTKMSLYNESSREVWTYRYFYGFYYQTPIIYDTAEIKSCYVALTFYPAFAVYTGNVEPTPYKGLYWNNKTTNLVKRAKYNDTTFVEWETLDIPSSLLPTGASLGVELFDYIVPIKGFVEIADLKLEYNTMCTQWTQFPGEVYGKNYKMDEKGFWIQANQNTMFIDEDEILATYKGINIFQINKDLAYFYKIQATESIEVGNYFLKTQQINSKNMLLLY